MTGSTDLQRAPALRDGELEATVVEGLELIPAGEWDALVPPGRAGLRHGFLRAWERAELRGLSSRPILVRREGSAHPVAAAAGYLYDLDMAAASHRIVPGLVGAIRRALPRFLVSRVYELGSPAAHTEPLLVAPGADQQRAAAAVADAAMREATSAGATMIVVQDHVPDPGPLAKALRERGFGSVATLPTVVVETERHPTFESYLRAMRSKYRYRARCVFRESAHLRAERVTDFRPLAAEFARLWRLVYDRADETKREVLTEEFFVTAAALEEVSAVVMRRQDGSIAIFGLLLDDHPWLHFIQCGFSEEAGRSEAAYFRLLFEVVRTAIEGGFKIAHLGCTTVGPKLDVGGVPVPLGAWIRHRNRPLQRLFVAGGNGRFAPPRVEARRVFSAGAC